MRNTFLLYIDRLEVLDEMTDADAGKLFKAIRDYVQNGSMPERGTVVSIAFRALKPALDSDTEKYRLMCLHRSEAGKKSGQARAKKSKNEQKGTKQTSVNFIQQKKTSVNLVEQKGTKRTDTDTDTDTDITSPTEEVISAHARETTATTAICLPVSAAYVVELDSYFLAQLKEMYPKIDTKKELAEIELKLVASNYPCKDQTALQKYVLAWFRNKATDLAEQSCGTMSNAYDASALNEKIRNINYDDV